MHMQSANNLLNRYRGSDSNLYQRNLEAQALLAQQQAMGLGIQGLSSQTALDLLQVSYTTCIIPPVQEYIKHSALRPFAPGMHYSTSRSLLPCFMTDSCKHPSFSIQLSAFPILYDVLFMLESYALTLL